MDLDEFIENALLLQAGALIGTKRLNAFYKEAAKRGINVMRPGSFAPGSFSPAATAESVGPSLARRVGGTLARRSPYIVGGAVGYEALRRSPELVGDIMDQWEGAQETLAPAAMKTPKKKPSKFNRAISAGMAAVKRSKSFGKPGKISNNKKAFASVTKTVSSLKKGRKMPKTGVRRTIARAVKRYI